MNKTKQRVRLAAVADLHCTRTAVGQFQPLFSRIQEKADVLLLCGDLTDHGLPEEAQVLAKELTGATKVPVLAVLGNHDYHSNQVPELERILSGASIHLLDGDECEVQGIGFAGVKGFGGGFGQQALEPWGEEIIKRFVYEAVEEALKLEKALARLGDVPKVALLHYAPVQGTVEGEPAAIFPFLGSSRLEEPLNRYGVTAVFHGHAHHGKAESKTRSAVPVYNVSLPLMRQTFGEQLPVRFIELAATPTADICKPARVE
jgi:Icc-related predicted phosphoesterase